MGNAIIKYLMNGGYNPASHYRNIISPVARGAYLLNEDKSLLVGLLFLEVDHRGEGGGRHPGEGERHGAGNLDYSFSR